MQAGSCFICSDFKNLNIWPQNKNRNLFMHSPITAVIEVWYMACGMVTWSASRRGEFHFPPKRQNSQTQHVGANENALYKL